MEIYVLAFIATDPRSKHKGSPVLMDGEGYWVNRERAESEAKKVTESRREVFKRGYYEAIALKPTRRN